MPESQSYVLRVEGVNYAYEKGEEVLKGISFNVQRGQIVCLLGPSGCGKSTLLRVIAGLLVPTSGHVWIDDADQAHIPTYRRNLGFVFQDIALFPHLSVEENLSFPFKRGKRKLNEPWPTAVNKILDLIGLQSHRNKRVATLSGGQAQRVALARAIVYQPSLLLLDEPLSSLDNSLKSQLLDLLIELHDKYNISFIYVTHDEREALRIGNHVLVLNERHELQQSGPLVEVINHPASPTVAVAIGGWNILRVIITEGGIQRGVCLENGSLIHELTLDYPVGTSFVLGVPLLACQLVSLASQVSTSHVFLSVQIARRSPWYSNWLYECFAKGEPDKIDAKILCYRQSPDEDALKEQAFVFFRKEEIRVFD